ncbi:unnamed protein product [Candidula unifasciata]|uniref:CHCH domain-containing protein n=1 Tax=Candidula unifasciata TaxID=100452 RepID=A0A8S4A7R6_9EUPU|nr:unnamed protein product [Candidula unifasciata]
MRLTDAVLVTAPLKKFTNYKNPGYKYKVVRIPALKDEVRVRKEQPKAGACVNEMSSMMDCWKRTDFSQAACDAEAQAFLKCIAIAEAEKKEALVRASKGLPAKGSNMRPSKQVNEMLAKFPQPPTNLL